MDNKKLLIIEDDNRLRKTLKKEFEERGYVVTEADSTNNIPIDNYNYCLVDMRLRGGTSGLNAIEIIKEISKEIRIVAITGYGSITTAVEAIKKGAINYLTKPVNIDQLENALTGKSRSEDIEQDFISLSQKENEYIDYMLIQNDWNITKTAKALGLHRQSLQRKLKKKSV